MSFLNENQAVLETAALPDIVKDCLIITNISDESGELKIQGTMLIKSGKAFKVISERLQPYRLLPVFSALSKFDGINFAKNQEVLIKIIPAPLIKPEKIWINILLLIFTIFSTIGAGILLSVSFFSMVDKVQVDINLLRNYHVLIYGVSFSFTLLMILGTHEFGHYFACKRKGIPATLPYFIPAPFPPLGTFGAIIRIKSPIPDKNSLITIGAAGPICGFIIAIPIIIIGLKLSRITSIGQAGQSLIGSSLLFSGLNQLFVPHIPQGYDIILHPIAFAGWVGLFVTALNLLPVGQLDGGHIVYSLIGNNNRFVGWGVLIILMILGFYWQGWLFWAIIVLFMIGVKHPPPLDSISPVDLKHKIIGVIALLIFIITFTPVPFSIK